MTEGSMHACCCPGAVALNWPLDAILAWIGFSEKETTMMAQNIKKSSKDIVKAALAAVPKISVEEALQLVNSDSHVFVDLRDGTE